jgi:pyruvate-ferredoxin/flavodoxin oxidoreductase
VKSIAVLDRTKEPGAGASRCTRTSSRLASGGDGAERRRGAAHHRRALRPVVARSSRPAMVKAVFDELAKDEPKRRFTVGITTT